MSEPESKKLEERLENLWARTQTGGGSLEDCVLFRDALAALREKDAMIEFLNDAIGGWKAGAREKDAEIAHLKKLVAVANEMKEAILEKDRQ